MNSQIKRFWKFLQQDTWQAWLVSIILAIIIIKFVLFPVLSLLTGSALPLVIVESCSMYHEANFNNWWESNQEWYEARDIFKEDFNSFNLKNGINKGDVIIVVKKDKYKIGEVIIFDASEKHPLIHRIISENPTETKGDHNNGQLSIEKDIHKDAIIGKAILRMPLVGWIKLIFFEPFRTDSQRGFC